MTKRLTLTVDGRALETDGYAEVRNPASGSAAGLMPVAGEPELDLAVAAARRAFATWGQAPDADRVAACLRVAEVLDANAEELARLLTLEQGKPLNGLGSRWEIGGAAAWTRYTAGLELPVEVLKDSNEGRVELHRKPIGVVGSITLSIGVLSDQHNMRTSPFL